MISQVKYKSEILAIIVYANYESDDIEFFTPESFSQQLGYMKRAKGYVIRPHVHMRFPREILYTKEVLYIKKGKIRVDFYTDTQQYLESKVLSEGDIILLAFGGHGIEMLEETEIIEVKQGPYSAELDKQRFEAIDKSQLKITD